MAAKYRREDGPKPIFPKLFPEEEKVAPESIERDIVVSDIDEEPVQMPEESRAITKDDLAQGFKMSVIIGEPKGRRGLQAFLKK